MFADATLLAFRDPSCFRAGKLHRHTDQWDKFFQYSANNFSDGSRLTSQSRQRLESKRLFLRELLRVESATMTENQLLFFFVFQNFVTKPLSDRSFKPLF